MYYVAYFSMSPFRFASGGVLLCADGIVAGKNQKNHFQETLERENQMGILLLDPYSVLFCIRFVLRFLKQLQLRVFAHHQPPTRI